MERMQSYIRFISFSLLTFFACYYIAAAQQGAQSKQKPSAQSSQTEDEIQETIEFRVTNIILPVSVLDNKNRFVPGLKKSDFIVLEDDRKQEIIDFQERSNLPLDVAILLDTSSSIKSKFNFEKDTALHFLQTILNRSKDRALIATFSSEVKIEQDYTNDVAALSSAVRRAEAGGYTKLYSAVYQISRQRMGQGRDHRGVMIIVSDGADTASTHTLTQAIDMAQRQQVMIYCITTESPEFEKDNPPVRSSPVKALYRLSEDTGGKVFYSSNLLELEQSFAQIREDLRNQYLLVYEPSNHNYDGRFRRIEVKLTAEVDKKNLQVRTRRGYRAANSSEG